jgi:tripartite-type tricarboxylate transporter receptor subunit TctC
LKAVDPSFASRRPQECHNPRQPAACRSCSWVSSTRSALTPAEVIEKLSNEINADLADPKLNARLSNLGGIVIGGSPADFGKLIADETEKWAKVIRAANIKAE